MGLNYRKYKYISFKEGRNKSDCMERNEVFSNDPNRSEYLKFVVNRQEKTYEFQVFDSFESFDKIYNINSNENYYHELIQANHHQKLRLDIDGKRNEIENLILDQDDIKYIFDQFNIEDTFNIPIFERNSLYIIKKIIFEIYLLLLVPDIVICCSKSNNKLSYHIIINNFYCENNIEAKRFCSILIDRINPEYLKVKDTPLYKAIYGTER